MSKRRRGSDNEVTNLQKRPIQERGEPSIKKYHDISLGGTASYLLGDNYGSLGDVHYIHNHNYPHPPPDRSQKLLDSLAFEYMDARFRNVATALSDTCQWLFQNEHFQAWSSENQDSENRGLLWIKGKPGSGKSTIMKELCAWAGKTWPDQIVLTYFFNARSPNAFEKTSLGLYRSFTHKLVELHPDGRSYLSTRFASKVQQDLTLEPWSDVELQNFLIDLITTRKLPALNIFVDALDEGDDEDVRNLIGFLDKLSDYAMRMGALVRICFSSRHYPRISIPQGETIVVEHQQGHDRDIAAYVRRYLAGDESEIDALRHRVCHRSAGIFLWVVLVVNMLNKLHDQGKPLSEILRKLESVPQDLHKVFAEILARDAEDIGECLTLLRWVLSSLRPLRPIELYFAVQASTSGKPDTAILPTHGVVMRYLSNCSRGLIELTEALRPTVQFIHETVRDFLINESILGDKQFTPSDHFTLSDDSQSLSYHAKSAEECLQYLIGWSQTSSIRKSSTKVDPFGEYAAEYWWQHARASGKELSSRLVDLALELMTNEAHLLTWAQHYNIGTLPQVSKGTFSASKLASPLYYAASIGLIEFVDRLLERDADVDAQGEGYGTALQVACYKGNNQVVQKLLDAGADVCLQGGGYNTALQAAATGGHSSIAQQLLIKGADVSAQGGYYGTALQAACYCGDEDFVQLLLQWNANVNSRGGYYGSPLEAASAAGCERIVQILLDRGAEFNAECGTLFGNALCAASAMGHDKVVEILLLDERAEVNAQGRYYGSALQAASRRDYPKIVRMLLEKGADVNAQGGIYGTALYSASRGKHLEVVQLLVSAGAEA